MSVHRNHLCIAQQPRTAERLCMWEAVLMRSFPSVRTGQMTLRKDLSPTYFSFLVFKNKQLVNRATVLLRMYLQALHLPVSVTI